MKQRLIVAALVLLVAAAGAAGRVPGAGPASAPAGMLQAGG